MASGQAADAAPADVAAPPEASVRDALARYEALRREGRLRVESRDFPGCPAELARRLERDPEGRIVAYSWDVADGPRRVRLQAIYGPDGAVAGERSFLVGTGEPYGQVKWRPKRPAEIDLDAPTACDR
jgi:hypothetical protein